MKILLFIVLLSMNYPGKREVLIFYNSRSAAKEAEQLSILNKESKGLQERDIEVHSYNTDKAIKETKQWNISNNDDFTLILVGKDGGEKLRTHTVVNTAKLFGVIDAMPMRKQEMKQQNK